MSRPYTESDEHDRYNRPIWRDGVEMIVNGYHAWDKRHPTCVGHGTTEWEAEANLDEAIRRSNRLACIAAAMGYTHG